MIRPCDSWTCPHCTALQSDIPFRVVTGDRARLLMANILASLYLDVCGAVLGLAGSSDDGTVLVLSLRQSTVNTLHSMLGPGLGPTSHSLKVSQVSDITPTPTLGDLSQPGTHHGEGSSLQDYR